MKVTMIMIYFLIKLSVYEKWVSTVVPRQRDDIIISDLDLKKNSGSGFHEQHFLSYYSIDY